jgi:hypothetical protein
MSAFTVVSVLGSENLQGRMKKVVCTATGTASYDANGSIIDLSTSGVLGTAHGFTGVHGVKVINVSAHGSDKYQFAYIRATPATGTLKVRDVTQAADAETSGDLSSITWTFEVIGY